MYNITFTSFPIIWFAVFDYQYEKDRLSKDGSEDRDLTFKEGDENYFMRNPMLYRLGMEQKCFSKTEMAKWIAYALWHAFVVYFINFWALTASTPYNSPKQSDGKDLGFWVAGHVLYGCCCFISNLTLAHKFHIHHWGGVGLIGLMTFAFFFLMFVESQWPFSVTLFADVGGIFYHMFSSLTVWLTLGLALGQVSIGEIAWKVYNDEKSKEDREVFRRTSIADKQTLKSYKSRLN